MKKNIQLPTELIDAVREKIKEDENLTNPNVKNRNSQNGVIWELIDIFIDGKLKALNPSLSKKFDRKLPIEHRRKKYFFSLKKMNRALSEKSASLDLANVLGYYAYGKKWETKREKVLKGQNETENNGHDEEQNIEPTNKKFPKLMNDLEETNVWYSSKEYPFFSIRNTQTGTLSFYDDGTLVYRRSDMELEVKNIKNVQHTKMPGDINDAWVKIVYLNEGKRTAAYFSSAKRQGMGNFWGGSEELYKKILKLLEIWNWLSKNEGGST